MRPAYPLPLPAAIGLACGIALAGNGVPAWNLLFLVPAAWPLALLLLRPSTDRGGPAPRKPLGLHLGEHRSAGLPPRALVALLLPSLLVAVGYGRYLQWESQPDPFAGLRERELVLQGVSDGRTLALSAPVAGRVAIAPAGALPVGEVSLRGTLVEASGKRNPGGFDYRGYLLRRGIHGQVLVEEVLASEPRERLLDRLRAGVRAGLQNQAAALMEAMTLGVRDELGDLRDTFAAAGLAHVLALSGLHVGLLMAAAGWLLAPLGLSRYPLLLLLDLGYMLLVGATPSVVRASVMVAVVLVTLWVGAGRIDPWPALGSAAIVTLLVRPAWLFDISLQLSYGAVSGILLFALPLARRIRGDPPVPWWHPRVSIVGAGLTSIAAQALTLPLVASSFDSLPLLSPLVNVIALPLASLLVPLGFAAGVFGLVAVPLALALNRLTGLVADLLLQLAEAGSKLPSLPWGEVESVGYLYFALAATASALAVNGLLRPWRALLVVTATLLMSGATPPAHPPAELVALDVGQGDALLLRLPDRVEVLMDGGGSPFSDFDVGAGIVLPALRAMGVDELELVAVSHADLDHVEGLITVLEEMPVQLLVVGVEDRESRAFVELLETAAQQGVPVRRLSRGELVRLGDALLEVLNPPLRRYGASNEDSLAFAVYLHGVPRALLLGDVSSAVERDLTPPDVDVLVAPHHGSATSTSVELLEAARPEEVVISVGRNSYGHPSPQVLERIARSRARFHLTRDAGAVRLPLGPPVLWD